MDYKYIRSVSQDELKKARGGFETLDARHDRVDLNLSQLSDQDAALIRNIQALATYHVSPYGSDTNDGSRYLPFKTIQKAMDVVVAGNSVCIFAGVYKEKLLCKTVGTVGSPHQILCELWG